jgi:hypothetical protein
MLWFEIGDISGRDYIKAVASRNAVVFSQYSHPEIRLNGPAKKYARTPEKPPTFS